jgi:hypothetical protein
VLFLTGKIFRVVPLSELLREALEPAV